MYSIRDIDYSDGRLNKATAKLRKSVVNCILKHYPESDFSAYDIARKSRQNRQKVEEQLRWLAKNGLVRMVGEIKLEGQDSPTTFWTRDDPETRDRQANESIERLKKKFDMA